VADQCHQMACAYLRQQQQTGALREDVLGEDVEDLAIDAVARLFERDDRGRFPEFRRYFGDRDVASRAAEDVQRDLRRLVTGAVTDWLFEAYRSADRSLSNAIRSLKRAATQHEQAELSRRGRALWLRVSASACSGREPVSSSSRCRGRHMPMETLEAHLTGVLADGATTKELLDRAVDVLRTHPDYEAAYPLTRLAQVLRAARVRVQAVTEHDGGVSHPDDPLFRPEEIETAIDRVITTLRRQKRDTYVEDGPLAASTYADYMQALRDRLEARFVPPADTALTHHEALAAHREDLSREQYRAYHRSRFEYLVQCAREALVDRLRKTL